MINNMEQSGREMVIAAMMQSQIFHFYLTGSQYFGGATPDSDFDFFTKNEPGTVSFLRDLGFCEVIHNKKYSDNFIAALMEHPTGIHVQLLKIPAEVKNAAQIAIKINIPDFSSYSVSARKAVWNLALSLVK